jgi:ABC-2 type transport system ATP-binding protein
VSEDAPLLELEVARIADETGALAPPLSLRADAATARFGLVGAFKPLFALLSGAATLSAGSARLLGQDARTAVRCGLAGLALFDPALPLGWTAEHYLRESAELSGQGRVEARRVASELLTRFELAGRARHELKDLLLSERRALVLAGATIGNPRVLVAEAPLARLDAASQAYLLAALERASEGRALVVSVLELPASGAERGLIDGADQVSWEDAGAAATTAADGARRFKLTVLRKARELCAALVESGIPFQTLPLDPLVLAFAGGNLDGVARLRVELPAGSDATPLLEIARRVEAPVVELVPA